MKIRNVVISVIMIFAMLLIPACGSEKNEAPETAKKYTNASVPDMISQITNKTDDSEYGGMYIDNAGKINIFILNGNKLGIPDSDNIVFKKADYSLSELTEEKDRLLAFINENNIDCPLVSVDISINRIKVIFKAEHDLSAYAGNPDMLNITVNPDYTETIVLL